ncbi:MAG: hypothetical protein H7317_09965 [Pseudorhodobacter sp.]|nr:hypothetical protein [Pseudorhodobacter sp.]
MSDQRPNPQVPRETAGNGGILFVLGAIVVAIGLLLWYVVGGNTTPATSPVTKTEVTIQAPASAPAAAAVDPVATPPDQTAPARPAEPVAPSAPAQTAPAAPAPAAPAPAAPAAPGP